jgi:hypothetical protein
MADMATQAKLSADSVTETHGGEEVVKVVTKRPPLADDEATNNAMVFINLREQAQSLGIAWYADGDVTKADQYHYADWAKKQLVEAWAPVLQKAGLRFPPAIKVITAEIAANAPMVMLMINNRKYRKEVEALRAENARMRAEQQAGATDAHIVAETTDRRDNKKAWDIDDNGFFVYGPSGNATAYIKQQNRKEKPTIPGDYEMLCKHNGKATVDKIFDIA